MTVAGSISSFFILANPRSGSSLLRLMLNNHPNICVPPECGFVQWLHAQTIRTVDEFVAALGRCRKIETWNVDLKALAAYMQSLQPKSYAEMCEAVYCFYAAGKDLRIWGDKNNYYVHHIDILETVFPATKYIHLVRDGRDVACSYRDVMGNGSTSIYSPRLDTDIGKIARGWMENILIVEDHLGRIAAERRITLRYEDLITDTAGTLRALCGFLHVDYSDEMLNYHLDGKHDEPAALMDWKVKTKQPVDQFNQRRYATGLSAQEVQRFEGIAGEVLGRFGYPQLRT